MTPSFRPVESLPFDYVLIVNSEGSGSSGSDIQRRYITEFTGTGACAYIFKRVYSNIFVEVKGKIAEALGTSTSVAKHYRLMGIGNIKAHVFLGYFLRVASNKVYD